MTTGLRVRDRMGAPNTSGSMPTAPSPGNTAASPRVSRCFMITIGSDNVVKAVEQVITPANMARIQPGWTRNRYVACSANSARSRRSGSEQGGVGLEDPTEQDLARDFSVHFDINGVVLTSKSHKGGTREEGPGGVILDLPQSSGERVANTGMSGLPASSSFRPTCRSCLRTRIPTTRSRSHRGEWRAALSLPGRQSCGRPLDLIFMNQTTAPANCRQRRALVLPLLHIEAGGPGRVARQKGPASRGSPTRWSIPRRAEGHARGDRSSVAGRTPSPRRASCRRCWVPFRVGTPRPARAEAGLSRALRAGARAHRGVSRGSPSRSIPWRRAWACRAFISCGRSARPFMCRRIYLQARRLARPPDAAGRARRRRVAAAVGLCDQVTSAAGSCASMAPRRAATNSKFVQAGALTRRYLS